MPGAPVALYERDRSGRPPRAGGIALHGLAEFLPRSDDRVDPAPCGLHLVAAHEQGLVAAHDVHDEALISVRVPDLEVFREGHVERHMPEPHPARPRILDHDPLLYAFVGLKPYDELVGEDRTRHVAEDRMRDRLELDDDFRDAACQALAGAQVEGHAGPAPVGDLGLDGDEGFGVALDVAELLDIALDRAACRRARPVLA